MAEESEAASAKPFPPDAGERNFPKAQTFIQNMYAPHSTVGSAFDGGGGGGEGTRRRAGRLDRDEVRANLKKYLKPACHDEALGHLRQNCVVALQGVPGLGKRTGALSLLDRVTEGELVELPPLPLNELAEYPFKPGNGYLVCGYKDGPGEADKEVTWLAVRTQVGDGEAHLVVTVNRELPRRSESVRQIAWQAPDPAVFLAEHHDPDTVTKILERLDGFCTMETLARIAAHRDVASALEELRASSIEPVRTWFAEPKPRAAVLDLAALSFLPGISERHFELLREPLTELLATHMPEAVDAQPQTAETELRRGRNRRVVDDGLVVRERGENSRTFLLFAAPAYHAEVLAQLSLWYSTPFWEALREWLEDVVQNGDEELRAAVAYGLSRLALTNLEEVEVSYLEPWSRYELGWAGQETATYLLWLMSDKDQLAFSALSIAKRWSSSPIIWQRWTAAIVFSGVLGLRYPFEAVRRLWSITVHGKELEADAITAIAGLFSTLVSQEEDPGPVLKLLELRLVQFGRTGTDARMKRLTVSAVLTVLSVPVGEGSRPAVVALLADRPDTSERIARLLAAMLVHRFYRRRAMDILATLLEALKGDEERGEDIAYRLCDHLGKTLSPKEQELLNTEFTARVAGRPETTSLADILRAAFHPDENENEGKDP